MTTTLADPLARARQLPKVLLHEHLDGGLRVATLLELLHRRGITPAADTPAGLAAWFDANAHAGSLLKYLEGFALTVEAMASPAAMERWTPRSMRRALRPRPKCSACLCARST